MRLLSMRLLNLV